MFYVIKWETTRYFLVGPFASDIPAYQWGEQNSEGGNTYTGWDVLELDNPMLVPELVAPDQDAPREQEPVHITLRPTMGLAIEAHGETLRPWFGHTNFGTPITAYIAAITARDRVPGEPETGPFSGAEAVEREMRRIAGPPMPTRITGKPMVVSD